MVLIVVVVIVSHAKSGFLLKTVTVWLVMIILYFSVVIICFSKVTGPELPAVSNPTNSASGIALVGGGNTKAMDEILKVMSPTLVAFITQLPAVEGISTFPIVLSFSISCMGDGYFIQLFLLESKMVPFDTSFQN